MDVDSVSADDCNRSVDDSSDTSSMANATAGGYRRAPVGRRGKSGAGSATNRKLNFKHSVTVREAHAKSIFGVAFNSANRRRCRDAHLQEPLLATVGGHYVAVYECSGGAGAAPELRLLQAYADPNADEEFYCVAWSVDDACRQQVVAAAGKRGTVRLICPALGTCVRSLLSHGQAVNELKFHPTRPRLLFSFGKDYTVRAWNVCSGALVAVFGGAEGHRSEVLHGDINLTGKLLLSCGMDHSVRIWRLDTARFRAAADASDDWCQPAEGAELAQRRRRFPTLLQHFPDLVTREVHGNYIDCARWFGNLVLSKSCENAVVLWKPGDMADLDLSRLQHCNESDHQVSVLHQLEAKDCNIWFIRFDIHLQSKVLALGNAYGKVYLWHLDTEDIFKAKPNVLNATKGAGAVRQTCFSEDGNILICVCDFGTIVRFDRADS